jgi:hypothetical protein
MNLGGELVLNKLATLFRGSRWKGSTVGRDFVAERQTFGRHVVGLDASPCLVFRQPNFFPRILDAPMCGGAQRHDIRSATADGCAPLRFRAG